MIFTFSQKGSVSVMKYMDYKEPIRHGAFDFPIAYYAVNAQHPRYHMMFHWHPEYEIVRIHRGQMRMNLDGVQFTAEAGDTVIVNDGVCHSGEPEDCEYECLVFDLHRFVKGTRSASAVVESILNHKLAISSRMPRGVEDLDTLLDGLFSAMRQRQPGYELFVQGYLCQWLGVVVRDHLYGPLENTARRRINQQSALRNALSFIEDNYANRVTLDDLARAAGMNRKYFCTLFHAMTGRTPIDYLNVYRVEMARGRLLYSEDSVTQVALACGYNDVSYFTKMFHRYTGTTPLNYRRDTQKEA